MITIIDYGAGNLKSVQNALDRLGATYEVTDDPAVVAKAEKVIFPGVGAAGSAMKELRRRGLAGPLKNLKVPLLGICLGMQLLFEFSEEDETKCLGIFLGQVNRFEDENLKVPQMGWNAVKFGGNCPLFKDVPDESYFYFVHSSSTFSIILSKPSLNKETVYEFFEAFVLRLIIKSDKAPKNPGPRLPSPKQLLSPLWHVGPDGLTKTKIVS